MEDPLLVGTEILNLSAVGHPKAKLHLTWLFTVKVPVDRVALFPAIGDCGGCGGGAAMVAVAAGCPRLTL
jgi:hypothetical protein